MENKYNTQEEEKIIKEIINRYGEVLNLKQAPFLIIEILRKYRNAMINDHDDGGLPGGVPPTPPGPSSFEGINHSILLKEILQLSKNVAEIKNDKLSRGTGVALVVVSSIFVFVGNTLMNRYRK